MYFLTSGDRTPRIRLLRCFSTKFASSSLFLNSVGRKKSPFVSFNSMSNNGGNVDISQEQEAPRKFVWGDGKVNIFHSFNFVIMFCRSNLMVKLSKSHSINVSSSCFEVKFVGCFVLIYFVLTLAYTFASVMLYYLLSIIIALIYAYRSQGCAYLVVDLEVFILL